MKRRDFSAGLGLSSLGLGLALPGLALAQGGPQEGRHYQRLGTPMPTTPGKIEVIEFFWYGCPHCYAFEPQMQDWIAKLPADVSFRHVHVAFRAVVKQHQRLFYTLEALGKEKELRARVFAAIHRDGKGLDTPKAMAEFLAPLGVDPAKFNETFNSFGVQKQMHAGREAQRGLPHRRRAGPGHRGPFWTSPSMAAAGERMNEIASGQRALETTNFLLQGLRTGKL